MTGSVSESRFTKSSQNFTTVHKKVYFKPVSFYKHRLTHVININLSALLYLLALPCYSSETSLYLLFGLNEDIRLAPNCGLIQSLTHIPFREDPLSSSVYMLFL